MTPELLNKIKAMIREIKERPHFLGPKSLDAIWNLDNLILEVEDYWNGHRVSRVLKQNDCKELKEVS